MLTLHVKSLHGRGTALSGEQQTAVSWQSSVLIRGKQNQNFAGVCKVLSVAWHGVKCEQFPSYIVTVYIDCQAILVEFFRQAILGEMLFSP